MLVGVVATLVTLFVTIRSYRNQITAQIYAAYNDRCDRALSSAVRIDQYDPDRQTIELSAGARHPRSGLIGG